MKPEDIEVSFFFDSEEDPNVTCSVAEITPPKISSTNADGSEASSECLDFVILTIKCPNDKAKKESLEKLEPPVVDLNELKNPERLKELKAAADAIVKIRVMKTKDSGTSNGTGYLIQNPTPKDDTFQEFAVMTNFHLVKQVYRLIRHFIL